MSLALQSSFVFAGQQATVPPVGLGDRDGRTAGGCACAETWDAPIDRCMLNENTFHGCGMTTPCDADTGGICGRSWCIIEPGCDGHPADTTWDYCTPEHSHSPEPWRDRPRKRVDGYFPTNCTEHLTLHNQADLNTCVQDCLASEGCNNVQIHEDRGDGVSIINCTLAFCTDQVEPIRPIEPGDTFIRYFVMLLPDVGPCCNAETPDTHAQGCIFPFILDDTVYNDCASYLGTQICPWQVEMGVLRIESWGLCNCGPMASTSTSTKLLTTTTRPPKTSAPTVPPGTESKDPFDTKMIIVIVVGAFAFLTTSCMGIMLVRQTRAKSAVILEMAEIRRRGLSINSNFGNRAPITNAERRIDSNSGRSKSFGNEVPRSLRDVLQIQNEQSRHRRTQSHSTTAPSLGELVTKTPSRSQKESFVENHRFNEYQQYRSATVKDLIRASKPRDVPTVGQYLAAGEEVVNVDDNDRLRGSHPRTTSLSEVLGITPPGQAGSERQSPTRIMNLNAGQPLSVSERAMQLLGIPTSTTASTSGASSGCASDNGSGDNTVQRSRASTPSRSRTNSLGDELSKHIPKAISRYTTNSRDAVEHKEYNAYVTLGRAKNKLRNIRNAVQTGSVKVTHSADNSPCVTPSGTTPRGSPSQPGSPELRRVVTGDMLKSTNSKTSLRDLLSSEIDSNPSSSA